MVCYAAQHNQLKPDRGNSGAILSCVTTLVGSFIGREIMGNNKFYHLPEYIKKQSDKKIGDKNPNWKGGHSYT
ncbi:hypothetical protein LCGC14_2967900, partial [marine sediment metagenome]